MRITKIIVRELFGNPSNEYEIELKNDPPITIIHGRNGSGKTAIFNMIATLFYAGGVNPFIFIAYPFREFIVEFDDGEHVKVTREYDAEKEEYLLPTAVYSNNNEPFELFTERFSNDIVRQWLSLAPRNRWARGDLTVNELMSLLPDEYTDYDFSDSISTYERRHAFVERSPNFTDGEPKWVSELRSRIDIHFVSTERLYVRREELDRRIKRIRTDNVAAIEENSRDLEKRINGVIKNANTRENELNSSFPSRVVNSVNAGNHESWSFKEVQPKLDELKRERERLVEVGLLEQGDDELQVDSYDDETLGSVLKIYIEDSKEKYREYENLADKITLYKTMVQELLNDKELVVSQHIEKGGFTFVSRNSQSQGEIPLRKLSSGEQHIIVLLYNLLFRDSEEKDELILIDEPEISLHVGWQKQFVSLLEQISGLSKFDVMIATHSPAIISGRWDLEVSLNNRSSQNRSE